MARAKSIAIADALLKIEAKQPNPNPYHLIHYRGTKHDLIAAGVATAAMFPTGKSRRTWSRHRDVPRLSVGYFASSRRDAGQFLLTRWKFWNDPVGAENERKLQEGRDEIERYEKEARLRAMVAARNAQETRALEQPRHDHADLTSLTECQQSTRIMLLGSARLLLWTAKISPVMSAEIDGCAELSAELADIAERFGKAEIRKRSLLKVVPIRPLAR